MKDLLERLNTGATLLGDGAMGSLLFARGVPSGTCPESVNLSNPGLLEAIARDYLAAGSDILQTNTFGGSLLNLAKYGLDSRIEEINQAAVAAVRRTAGDRAYVSGSCGPSGRILEPAGDADPQEVFESFRRQLRVLIKEGVDLVCIETMTDLQEACLAIQAAREISASIPIMATMTFDPTPRGFFTIMGVSIEKAAAGLVRAGADIVGSNCGNGVEVMVEVARGFRKVTTAKLAIQSNAGMPELVGEQIVYRETPEFMAGKAREFLALGISILGGCCGTTPAHIAALRRLIDTTRLNPRNLCC